MSPHGRVHVGTSGFSYPGWVPKFYAPGKASRKLLAAYATRLPAVELHNFGISPSAMLILPQLNTQM